MAAEVAAVARVTVLTGGPGTGKTTTVARLLALLAGPTGPAARLRIALAAPTGKAAARLQEAVQLEIDQLDLPTTSAGSPGLQATTLHRLLGWRPDSSRGSGTTAATGCRYDVIVVDETSMVSLTMMARLLEAVRADARLVLVGDPDQLASVEAGAVLADLVDGLGAARGLTRGGACRRRTGSASRSVRWRRRSARGDADAALAVLRAGG